MNAADLEELERPAREMVIALASDLEALARIRDRVRAGKMTALEAVDALLDVSQQQSRRALRLSEETLERTRALVRAGKGPGT